ncbi:putative retrotransposable element tf2 155 kda protein type 1-like [Lyophyllum shimeji]|uniref:Retrotransposable element tf2 155 kDa protein type 1-like n=1 Tax=Lyophyllum shimeji TaxID=47721 RepID=A0A9P3UIG6_LYOSH|nr:putative retrotransposable element tf2 155 kda protein type 1-like [Lyophyllum shimeji]
MFFGLTNSPATFQTMMNDIFRDLIAQGVVCVYLDDILIYTKTLEEHRRITRIVLDRLREHRLFLKPEKCEFERTEIEYLGLIISHGTLQAAPYLCLVRDNCPTKEISLTWADLVVLSFLTWDLPLHCLGAPKPMGATAFLLDGGAPEVLDPTILVGSTTMSHSACHVLWALPRA